MRPAEDSRTRRRKYQIGWLGGIACGAPYKVAILGRHFLLATSVAIETVLDRPRSWLASKQTIKQGST